MLSEPQFPNLYNGYDSGIYTSQGCCKHREAVNAVCIKKVLDKCLAFRSFGG